MWSLTIDIQATTTLQEHMKEPFLELVVKKLTCLYNQMRLLDRDLPTWELRFHHVYVKISSNCNTRLSWKLIQTQKTHFRFSQLLDSKQDKMQSRHDEY